MKTGPLAMLLKAYLGPVMLEMAAAAMAETYNVQVLIKLLDPLSEKYSSKVYRRV